MIEVYTDGACLGNPGAGGWGFYAEGKCWASGFAEYTTNNKMELTAAIEAISAVKGKLTIYSDSKYICDAVNLRWLEGWKRNGWCKSDGNQVANMDLWRRMDKLLAKRKVMFHWVKAHSGNVGNEIADRLAVEAARAECGRSGTTDSPFPDGLPSYEEYKKKGFYGGSQSATQKQISYAKGLIEKSGQTPDMKELKSMTKSEISQVIQRLKA